MMTQLSDWGLLLIVILQCYAVSSSIPGDNPTVYAIAVGGGIEDVVLVWTVTLDLATGTHQISANALLTVYIT